MKKLVVVAMIFLLGTAWWSTIDNLVKKAEYRQHIAAAEKYEKQQIYYDAVLEYKNALEENPDQGDLWIKIAQDYRNLGSDDEFEEACNQAISLEDDKHEALFMLTDYYLEEGRREDAIALLKRQAEKTKYNGDIKEKLQSLAGEVQTVSADYDEISTECSGYMYVKSGDLYGFLNSSGQEILNINQSDYLETGELHRFRKMGKVTTLIQIIINAGSRRKLISIWEQRSRALYRQRKMENGDISTDSFSR